MLDHSRSGALDCRSRPTHWLIVRMSLRREYRGAPMWSAWNRLLTGVRDPHVAAATLAPPGAVGPEGLCQRGDHGAVGQGGEKQGTDTHSN